jgi:hypothetical protein
MGLREICWESLNWTPLPQGRHQSRAFVNSVMNVRVP